MLETRLRIRNTDLPSGNRKKGKPRWTSHASQQPSKFQTQKQLLRDTIHDSARHARDASELGKILFEKYGINLKENRGQFSYLRPKRPKFITDRSLSVTLYETDSDLKKIAGKISDRPNLKEETKNYKNTDQAA